MSFKVHNGYKLKKNMGVFEMNNHLVDLMKKVKQSAIRQLNDTRIRLIYNVYDYNLFGVYHEVMYFMHKKSHETRRAVEEYLKDFQNYSEIRHSYNYLIDLDFEILIIPIPKKTLALLYVYNDKLKKIFKQSGLFEDYHYQDQSDRPKTISTRNWRQREVDWNIALGGEGSSSPSECGFSYKPYKVKTLFYEPVQYPIRTPSLKERVDSTSKAVFDQRTPKLIKAATLGEWIDYRDSKEGKTEFKKIVEEVTSVLSKEEHNLGLKYPGQKIFDIDIKLSEEVLKISEKLYHPIPS